MNQREQARRRRGGHAVAARWQHHVQKAEYTYFKYCKHFCQWEKPENLCLVFIMRNYGR